MITFHRGGSQAGVREAYLAFDLMGAALPLFPGEGVLSILE